MATRSKAKPLDLGVGMMCGMTYWDYRDRDDPEYRWRDKVLKPHSEVKEFLENLGVKYRVYERRLKKRQFGRPVYQLSVRFHEENRREALLFALNWSVPKDMILRITRVEMDEKKTSRGHAVKGTDSGSD